MLFGSVNLFAEARFHRSFSVVVAGNYWYSKKGTLIFNRFDQQHTGLTLELRKYPDQLALTGFYLGPYLKYRQILQKNVVNYLSDSLGANSIEAPAQNQKWSQLAVGFMFGYQHIFSSGLLVESFAGGGYYFLTELNTPHPEWVTNFSKASRVDLRAGVGVGFVF